MAKTPPKKKLKKKKTNPVGRPTKYKPKYCQAIIDYFDRPILNILGNANDPPFFLNFCLSIEINQDTMHEWISKHPKFSEAYKIAKEKQKEFIITNALQNRYNGGFAWRAMMNMHGWRDQQNLQVGMDEATLNTILSTLPPEQADATKKALIAKAKKK